LQKAKVPERLIALSRDPKETCLYLADLTSFTVYVLNRDNITELGRFGTGGRPKLEERSCLEERIDASSSRPPDWLRPA
jgi:hypothetical protein